MRPGSPPGTRLVRTPSGVFLPVCVSRVCPGSPRCLFTGMNPGRTFTVHVPVGIRFVEVNPTIESYFPADEVPTTAVCLCADSRATTAAAAAPPL